MGYDFSRPCRVTDENLPRVRAWLTTWAGRRSRTFVIGDKRCPVCASYLIARRFCRWERDGSGAPVRHIMGLEAICPYCQRPTVQDPWVPDNDNPSMEVAPHRPGWVLCPGCGKTFSLTPYSWDGERHQTCGQRLRIRPAELPEPAL